MFWVSIPIWLRRILPQLVWDIPVSDKKVYLTFDDGPTPEVTPRVLAFLREYNALATFFCLGSEAEKYSFLVEQIRADGHEVGNHGYLHLSGFSTSTKRYVANALKGGEITKSHLFRPPYGRITPWQIYQLKGRYRIVNWSIMSGDFSAGISADQCLKGVIENVAPGSILVFHDTLQAGEKLLVVLPALLQWLTENGYKMETLKERLK
jgi:peptidoglycan-N-acetylglucosamine deacetylase